MTEVVMAKWVLVASVLFDYQAYVDTKVLTFATERECRAAAKAIYSSVLTSPSKLNKWQCVPMFPEPKDTPND